MTIKTTATASHQHFLMSARKCLKHRRAAACGLQSCPHINQHLKERFLQQNSIHQWSKEDFLIKYTESQNQRSCSSNSHVLGVERSLLGPGRATRSLQLSVSGFAYLLHPFLGLRTETRGHHLSGLSFTENRETDSQLMEMKETFIT